MWNKLHKSLICKIAIVFIGLIIGCLFGIVLTEAHHPISLRFLMTISGSMVAFFIHRF